MKHRNTEGVVLVIDEPEVDSSLIKVGGALEWSNEKNLIHKNCSICGQAFATTRNNKNICSWPCKQEHNRQHARYYARMRRNNLNTIKKYEPCVVCGFSETTDQHHEGKEVIILCPNHHCLITRNIKTFAQLLKERG